MIGHSLGGHAVGFAAKLLKNPKVHRVTGLDPSGMYFFKSVTINSELIYEGPGINLRKDAMHLHYTDATIVDVFHTDIGMGFSESLGTETKLGYYDFYPNGGLKITFVF